MSADWFFSWLCLFKPAWSQKNKKVRIQPARFLHPSGKTIQRIHRTNPLVYTQPVLARWKIPSGPARIPIRCHPIDFSIGRVFLNPHGRKKTKDAIYKSAGGIQRILNSSNAPLDISLVYTDLCHAHPLESWMPLYIEIPRLDNHVWNI